MRASGENLPDSILFFSSAALVWLFGVLVFMPMAKRIDPERLLILLSLIIFSAFTIFLVRGLKGFGKILDELSEILAHQWTRKKREAERPIENTIKMFKILIRVATIMIIYLLYFPILISIHPSINGIAIILAILIIILILGKKVEQST